jgi:subtilase family serine protease
MSNGQTITVTYNWKAKKGSHAFDATVDPSNNITEIKEDNNAFAQQTIVVKAKDKKPGPSFEAGVFIAAVLVVLFVMGNSKGRNRKP